MSELGVSERNTKSVNLWVVADSHGVAPSLCNAVSRFVTGDLKFGDDRLTNILVIVYNQYA